MLTYKKLNKSGGLTIPRMIRQEAGIVPGTAVDVLSDESGIHITKHVPACFHCGSVDDVAACYGMEICRDCAKKMMEVFENDRGR